MDTEKDLLINSYQAAVGYVGTEMGDFFQILVSRSLTRGWNPDQNIYYLMSQAYTYGVIRGKRIERLKKSQQL